MNLNYIHINNNIFIEFQETINLNVLLETNKQLLSNPELDYLDYQILNFLKVKKFDITLQEIKIFLVLQKNTINWNKKMKTAIVTSNDELTSQMNIQISNLNMNKEYIRIFKNIDDALNWCNSSDNKL